LKVNSIQPINKIINNDTVFVSAAVLFKFALEISYVEFLVPAFGYSGYRSQFSLIKYFESWVIYLVLIALLPKTLRLVSDYLLVYAVFVFITPLIVYYSLSGQPRTPLYLCLAVIALMTLFRSGPAITVPIIRNGKVIAGGLGIGAVVGTTVWMITSGGLAYFNLDFDRIYEFRRSADAVLNKGLMSYINVWTTKVFGPALLAICLWKRKFWVAASVCMLHLFWFGVSSHKGILFYPALVISIWYWFRSSRALFFVPLSLLILVTSALILFRWTDNIIIPSLIVRRALFDSSFLTFTYYNFFQNNDFIYWSNSFLSEIIRYPYMFPPEELIGRSLGSAMHANTSMFATGFMHAGIFGVVLYGSLAGILFKLVDSCAFHGLPTWVAVALLVAPGQALLTGTDFFSALLTHGLAAALLLLLLYRGDSKGDFLRM
jgi:hypothetical protein